MSTYKIITGTSILIVLFGLLSSFFTVALFITYPTNRAINNPPNGSIIFDVK